MMQGGDEVSALVIDMGSHSCKAGYAGDDMPRAVFPTVFGYMAGSAVHDQPQKKMKVEEGQAVPTGVTSMVGAAATGEGRGAAPDSLSEQRKLFIGATALGYRRDNMEVAPAMRDGLVDDWDAAAAMWEHAVRDRLRVDPADYAILLAEPSFNSSAHREKSIQLMFETLCPPAIFCAKNAVLASFACGKGTALVVDSGHSQTTVCAVHEGYVLNKSLVRSPVAGELLTDCLMNILDTKYKIKIRPRYSFKRKEITPGDYEVEELAQPLTTASYRLYMQKAIVSDIKESVCRVPDTPFDEAAFANVPTTAYELPDGQVVEVGGDRFRVADLLFNPALIKTIPGMDSALDSAGGGVHGLSRMVVECIAKCDADIRKELFSSILISGGTMAMQQVKERLERQLLEEAPPTVKPKVLASGNMVERKFSVWIGGSILASLGTFQKLWLSKAEYEEYGAAYIHRKCP